MVVVLMVGVVVVAVLVARWCSCFKEYFFEGKPLRILLVPMHCFLHTWGSLSVALGVRGPGEGEREIERETGRTWER